MPISGLAIVSTMKRLFLLFLLCASSVACNRQPANDDGKKPRPGETIEARFGLPKFWTHGKDGELSVVYELRRPGRAEPIQLEAADLPSDFQPDLIITFEANGNAIGAPLRVVFNPDC